ncbi:hypothetical protein Y032_0077g1145 [Ancylostoma ceylanicum]|uniref:Uncharacterized protein n=1 Tax=Ancylostoma ceylanicum TaxID=53326 RepID=A0A016TTE7_9BILA|nr:hypothetical protein Y032_0077g1145 [Ancylostoma ceylanicum]
MSKFIQSLQKIYASRRTARLLIRATSPMHYHTWCDVAELTGDVALFSGVCTADHAPIDRGDVAREANHLLLKKRELVHHSCHTTVFNWSVICSARAREQIIYSQDAGHC